jgi:hypothetical protein
VREMGAPGPVILEQKTVSMCSTSFAQAVAPP